MSKKLWHWILCGGLFLSGCATDAANRYYLSETLPPKNVEEVAVLREEPLRPYDVIAEFQAMNASVNYMRKNAAKIGADAVIVVPAGGWRSRDEAWAGNDEHSNSYTRLIGIALRYKN